MSTTAREEGQHRQPDRRAGTGRGVRRTRQPVVLLWTSPLAKKWSEARPEEPGEVAR
ncbi:hypothetical protein [Streptomyces sp. NPDC002994]|uniref:hypothetical protein n=1 Tax=Streptomyces sp. NPDC002994 TaxID=3154441 RepID=UPI0033BBFA36